MLYQIKFLMETTQECGAEGIIVYFQYVTFNFRIKVNT